PRGDPSTEARMTELPAAPRTPAGSSAAGGLAAPSPPATRRPGAPPAVARARPPRGPHAPSELVGEVVLARPVHPIDRHPGHPRGDGARERACHRVENFLSSPPPRRCPTPRRSTEASGRGHSPS